MRFVKLLLGGLMVAIVLALVGVGSWLWLAPPDLIRVGAAYSAKIVCSNVFLAGRDADAVLAEDVQAPGHPLLRLMRVDVDRQAKTVTAGLLGVFGPRVAVARAGFGCTVVPDGMTAADLAPVPELAAMPAEPVDRDWPLGRQVRPLSLPTVDTILDDPAMTGPGMRAVVVVQTGRIVAERYGSGFTAQTPLLGWSMTKTVNAALAGMVMRPESLGLEDHDLFASWREDDRKATTFAQLLGMTGGLEFNEDYGDVTDVTRMLFLERDMAGFAADKPAAHPPGSTFSYSSGTAMLVSRLWQDAAGGPDVSLALPRERLFKPLGMTSATLEVDAAGTFVGSSYLYATARDWARFGQLLLQDGIWNAEPLAPTEFVRWMREPGLEGSDYGRGQIWRRGPDSTAAGDAAAGVPEDAYWLIGHDGQSIAIVPSQRLIVLRMGLTPRKLGYQPQPMVAALARTLSLD